MIIKNHPEAKILNRKLLKDFADLQSNLLLADDEMVIQYLNPTPIIQEVIKPKQTVFDFTNGLIGELRLDNKIGNAWVYESALNALRKYQTNTNLYFENIDYQFLKKYNKLLIRSGVKHNTAFFYLRTLRAFYDKAVILRIGANMPYISVFI